MTPAPPQIEYCDSSKTMATKASTELLKVASKEWNQAKTKAHDAADLQLQSLNHLRLCGLALQEAAGGCGKSRLTSSFFRHAAKQLPRDLTLASAKFAVHVANHFPEAITSLDESRKARKLLFQNFGQEKVPKRIEQQTAREYNPWSELVRLISTAETVFTKLDNEPMAEWGKERLVKFCAVLSPVVEKFEAAAALLEK